MLKFEKFVCNLLLIILHTSVNQLQMRTRGVKKSENFADIISESSLINLSIIKITPHHQSFLQPYIKVTLLNFSLSRWCRSAPGICGLAKSCLERHSCSSCPGRFLRTESCPSCPRCERSDTCCCIFKYFTWTKYMYAMQA